jgi:hypothetical protein
MYLEENRLLVEVDDQGQQLGEVEMSSTPPT